MPQFTFGCTLNTFNALRCDVLRAGVGYCSPVFGPEASISLGYIVKQELLASLKIHTMLELITGSFR